MKKNKMVEMIMKNDEDPSIINDPKISRKTREYDIEWLKYNEYRYHDYQKKYREKKKWEKAGINNEAFEE